MDASDTVCGIGCHIHRWLESVPTSLGGRYVMGDVHQGNGYTKSVTANQTKSKYLISGYCRNQDPYSESVYPLKKT